MAFGLSNFGGVTSYNPNPGLSLNVRIQTDLIVWTSGLTTQEIKQAINRGINYATARAKTRIKRMVVQEYNLKSNMVGNDALKRVPSTTAVLSGYVYAASRPESLGHFNPVWYRDVLGNKRGGGFIKSSKRGKSYVHKTSQSNTSRSGVYFQVVKGKTEHLPGAWLYFSGSTPIVMAKGQYKKSNSGKTKDFNFADRKGPRYPIDKLNTKSVYWGVLHPKTTVKWEPDTERDYLKELTRQVGVILQLRP